MKKVTSLVLALVLCMALCIPAFAEEQQVQVEGNVPGFVSEETLGEPIKVINSVDENGNKIIEEIYFIPDAGTLSFRSASGSGTLYKYHYAYFSSQETDKIKFFVAAHFTWNPDEVIVSLPFGSWDHSTVPAGCEVSISMGDQGNSTWYRNYAFATMNYGYSTLWSAQSGEVTIKVDKNGEVS